MAAVKASSDNSAGLSTMVTAKPFPIAFRIASWTSSFAISIGVAPVRFCASTLRLRILPPIRSRSAPSMSWRFAILKPAVCKPFQASWQKIRSALRAS